MTVALARLGITVMPEFMQCEGVEPVLRNIAEVAGATSVTTVPSVMAPATAATGHREPPIDGGAGGRRVLDRTLWGQHALFTTTAPSYVPDPRLYAEAGYPPPQPTALTDREGGVVAAFLTASKARGLETYLQVMAAIPPGIRVQFGGPRDADRARTADGRSVSGRVDNNASLASPAIRSFMRALIRDLVQAYPNVDGLRFDWPEYPPYHLDTLLFDYSPAAVALAGRLGYDAERIRSGLLAALARFGDKALSQTLDTGLEAAIAAHPAISEHFELRAALVADYAAFLCAETQAQGKRAFMQGFPPPWNTLSGFDLGRVAPLCDAIGVKLYTMHWPMIERNYVEELVRRGMGTWPEVARAVRAALGTTATVPATVDDLRYPEPDEPHPADSGAIIAKVEAARAQAGKTEFWAMGHGYGPCADMLRRLHAAGRGSGGNVYLNRYGYLSDEKLQAIGKIVKPQNRGKD